MNERELERSQAFGELATQAILICDSIFSGREPEDIELRAYMELRAQAFGSN